MIKDDSKTKKNKILIIGHFPPPYDGTSVALDILRNSEVMKFFFNVIHLNTSRFSFKNKDNIGRFRWYKIIQDIYHIFNFFNKLFKEKPDIVYLTIAQTKLGFLRDSIFIRLSKLFKKSCIVHIHGGYFGIFYENSFRLLRKFIGNAIAKVDKVIVLADSLKYMVEGLIAKEKVLSISNCVPKDVMPQDKDVNEKLNKIRTQFDSNSIKILYLSNLIKTKGYFDLLRAIKILINQGFYNIKLYLAGAFQNQEEELEMSEFIRREGLDKNVKFHGVVTGEKKKKLFFESNIFVLPTYHHPEGQPVAIMEAMSYGLPVITTNYRAIPSMITEQKNGFFVPPKSPDKIAEAITRFIKDSTLIYKMGQENSKKAHDEFTEKKYIEKFVKLFKEVLK